MANSPVPPPASIQSAAPDFPLAGSRMYGFQGASVSITQDTILSAAYSGLTLLVNNGAGVNLTVPSTLPRDFNCGIIQIGAGQATIVAGAGATISGAFTKTSAQWAMIGLYAYADGSVAVVGNGV